MVSLPYLLLNTIRAIECQSVCKNDLHVPGKENTVSKNNAGKVGKKHGCVIVNIIKQFLISIPIFIFIISIIIICVSFTVVLENMGR